MLDAAPHRGDRQQVQEHGAVALGVSQDDEVADGSISTGNGLVAAFSGRLDNAADLRQQLAAHGRLAAGETPAAIVEEAFRVWGEGAPARLRGQFAAVVTDGERIWSFRDQVGFRAVYYREDGHAVHFASEAKQVLAGAGTPREPDLDAVERIFFGQGGGPDADCAVKGVTRMAAATVLSYDRAGRRRADRYWEPERLVETGRFTPAEAQERFAELFDQAVRRCLTGNDAVSLSGGIDSPAVAAFATPGHEQRFGTPVGALSAVFPDLPSVDESGWISLVAQHLGMPLHTYRPQAKGLDDAQRWSDLLDSPTPIVSVPELDENYALARRLGHRSLLTGELAEYVIDSRGHLAGHLLMHGRLSAVASLVRTQRRRGAGWPFIARQFVPSLVPGRMANSFLNWRGVKRAAPAPGSDHQPRCDDDPAARSTDPGTAAMAQPADLLLRRLLRDTRGRRGGGGDPRHGYPPPFVDVDLWEFFLSLRAEVKYPDTRRKTLVKRCLRGRLPDAILDRRDKTVFGEHLLTHADYDVMRRYTADPPHRFAGVDYRRLAERLDQGDFTLWEYCWARDLTSAHAFLANW